MFDDVAVYSNEVKVPQVDMQPVQRSGGIVAIEQSRAVAEAQAAMIIARSVPRDENQALVRILQACKRISFAQVAQYAYKRGTTIVTGPSIRMAEVLARAYGNLNFGFRELSRNIGSSEIESFCWDLETNTKVSRTFTVNHIREKKGGNEALTGERDIYELIANMAQRRVRACILEIIPGDIVERAISQCNKTLETGDKPLEDRVRDMVTAFAELGVTPEMLEARLQHKLSAVVAPELVQMTQIYRSIRDGIASREDFFSLTPTPQPTTGGGGNGARPAPPPQEATKDSAGPWDRSKWTNLRRGFESYVIENIATFGEQPTDVQQDVMTKWERMCMGKVFPWSNKAADSTATDVPADGATTDIDRPDGGGGSDWTELYPEQIISLPEFQTLASLHDEFPEEYAQAINMFGVPASIAGLSQVIALINRAVDSANQ